MLTPVLLSGGVGSRLWPVSREACPKQFLALASELTMLQDTMQRTAGLESASPIVICNEEHRFMVAEQLRQLAVEAAAIILEPEGRNTAPAVALAAFQALQTDKNAVLLVLPADHVIRDTDAFTEAVALGVEEAGRGTLMTFGVVPDSPETGYGYLRLGAPKGENLFVLDSFIEKPDAETAQSYLDSGKYYWNSGMFLMSAQSYLDELKAFAPAIFDACERSIADASKLSRNGCSPGDLKSSSSVT